MTYALKDNQIQEVDPEEVDLELESPNQFFSLNANTIPLPSAVQAPRVFYGSRFGAQAVPLTHREAPLVQNAIDGDPEGKSFDEYLGRKAGAVFSDEEGEVLDVSADRIRLRTAAGEKDVELYNKFPFNSKTLLHNTPLVKPGDKVRPGQILANSNYTDDKGTLALGVNLRIGLVPYKGFSMDDAVVISESAAKKLTSEQNYLIRQDFGQGLKNGVQHFTSLFPTAFTKEQVATLDDTGVVKPGTVLKKGDPMILATRPRSVSSASTQLGSLSKVTRDARMDASQVWDHNEEGVVTDVAYTKDGVKVYVDSLTPAQKGDKLALRSGQKGVISLILPDEHMPRTLKGEPMEMLLNPLGVPSRANDSMIYELALGKAAALQKQPLKLSAFTPKGERWQDVADRLMETAGIKHGEYIFDPTTGKLLENPVGVGNGYVLKLHHMSEGKSSARSQGGYDADQLPQRGGGKGGGAKKMSTLEIHALLSSGAYKTLKESSTIRGQKNDEFWRAIRQGHRPKTPGAPFVWDKFQALLAGSGMHARKIDDARTRLGPFTDKDLETRKPVEITKPELVNLHDFEPISGGLFDRGLVQGNRWGKISLPFPVPNPAFETSIRHLLGLTQKELREIMAGTRELPEHLRAND